MVAKVLGTGLAIVALAAVALLAIPAVRHLREVAPPSAPAIRAAFPVPPGTQLGSGDDVLDAAISPDQREIVFVATSEGTAALWRRALDSDRADRIAGTEGARLPSWKQTANVISFFAGDRLKQVSLADGAVRDLAATRVALGASWLPDGSLLFAGDARSGIRRLRSTGVSEATRLRNGDRSHAFPIAAGAGNSFIYTATLDTGESVVRLVDAGVEHELVKTSGHGQLVGNVLLYVRDSVLLGQRIDPETRQVAGRAVPMTLDIGIDQSGHSYYTASPRMLISAPDQLRRYQPTWFTVADGQRTTTREPADYWQVRLAPDDRFAALTQTTPLVRTLDIVLAIMSETGYIGQLTRAVAADSDPVWSPDGRRLAFRSSQDGPPRLYTHALGEHAVDEIVPQSTTDETPTDWRDDRIFVHGPSGKGDLDLWTVNVRTGARERIISTAFNETDARLSPDGRWLAFVSDESGQADIYATPWPRGPRTRLSFVGGTHPRWHRNGRTLFFVRGSDLMRTDLTSDGFTVPRVVLDVRGIRDFDVAHRRDALLALLPTSSSTTATPSVIVDWRSLVN